MDLKRGDLPTSPSEIAEVIRERAEALNTVLAYAYSLSMKVSIDLGFAEDAEDQDGELVNIDCIEQVLSL